MTKIVTVLALSLCLHFGLGEMALAAPKGKNINSLARRYKNLDRKASRLVGQFRKLSSSQRSELLGKLSGKYDDADDDNLPDFLDSGTGRCDSDRDDDGIKDGFDDDGDPTSTPSPGPSGSVEVEIHGTIQSVTDSSITVNSVTFTLVSNTEYLDDRNNPVSKSTFVAGSCIEIEGFRGGTGITAEKVKLDDDC